MSAGRKSEMRCLSWFCPSDGEWDEMSCLMSDGEVAVHSMVLVLLLDKVGTLETMELGQSSVDFILSPDAKS